MTSKVLLGSIPYDVFFFGKPPSYQHLKCFALLCYGSIFAHIRGTFDLRNQACKFMSYPSTQKGYKLLVLDNRKQFGSRDVQFNEEVFPFVTGIPTIPSHTFPVPRVEMSSETIFY